MSDDLLLKQLGHFIGTEQYHSVLGTSVTDGVAYIMGNGYSWFVTDAIAVIKTKFKTAEFISVKLKLYKVKGLTGMKGTMIIDDGNNNVLYTQDYDYTDAKVELNLFYIDGVLLLSSEY